MLCALFDELIVPPAVVHELAHPPAGQPLVDVHSITKARVVAPADLTRLAALRLTLHPGESEAIVVALESGTPRLLIDDADGRAEATRLGLSVIGVLACFGRPRNRS